MIADQGIDVWPENWPVVQLFLRMGTQWRTTFGGASGLDYNVLFRLMDDEGLSREEQRLMLDDIQILETQAMKTMQGE